MNAADDLSELSFDQLMELQRRADERAAVGGSGGHGTGSDDGRRGSDDDVVVLPWWQHPLNILTLVVAAALIAGMIGWMVGDAGGAEAHNEVDTGFLQDMRLHHEQAVEMSQYYLSLPGTDAGLSVVAGSIIQGQTLEVGRMIQLLRDFGEPEANEGTTSMSWMGMAAERGAMEGMATEVQLEQLRNASGADADALFAELMIAHHEGGIHMAEYAAEHARSGKVKSFAESVITGQQSEIAEIQLVLA